MPETLHCDAEPATFEPSPDLVDRAALNELRGFIGPIRNPDDWHLVNGLRFRGFIYTVAVFDSHQIVHRIMKAACHECAWERAKAWIEAARSSRYQLPCSGCNGDGVMDERTCPDTHLSPCRDMGCFHDCTVCCGTGKQPLPDAGDLR